MGVEVERGESIRTWEHPGLRRISRWRWGHASGSECVHVEVGVLPDGRWYAERGGVARAYPDEGDARAVAGNLMADREGWREVPAVLGPDQQPKEPGWVRRGGEWFREVS